MNSLIKEKLTEYLGFDSNLLFKYTDYLVVFGGAIRDIISDKSIENITDIDILCLSQSRNRIMKTVIEHGYKNVDLQRPELHNMYKDMKFIFEPKTFMKDGKTIQFITPCTSTHYKPKVVGRVDDTLEYNMKETFYYLLSNVDLITSGVFYDGYDLYESVKGSIYFIESKKIVSLRDNLMYNSKRVQRRIRKLENNDYIVLDRFLPVDVKVNRLLKLNRIKSTYPSIVEYKKGIDSVNINDLLL